jgi:hypothetical protein
VQSGEAGAGSRAGSTHVADVKKRVGFANWAGSTKSHSLQGRSNLRTRRLDAVDRIQRSGPQLERIGVFDPSSPNSIARKSVRSVVHARRFPERERSRALCAIRDHAYNGSRCAG